MARIGGDELERALAEVSGWEAESGVQRRGHPDQPERIFEWLQANGVDADAFAEFTSTRLPAEPTEYLRPRTVYLQGFAVGFRAAQIAAERSALQIGKAAFERAEADDEFLGPHLRAFGNNPARANWRQPQRATAAARRQVSYFVGRRRNRR